MGVRLDPVFNAVPEALGVEHGSAGKSGISGKFVGKPQLACPEAIGPLIIGRFSIEAAGAENVFECFGESLQAGPRLPDGSLDGLCQLLFSHHWKAKKFFSCHTILLIWTLK